MVDFEKRKIYCLAEILSSLDYYQGLRNLVKEQIKEVKAMDIKDKKTYEKTLKKDLEKLNVTIYELDSILTEISKFSSLKLLNFVKDVLNYSSCEDYVVIPNVSGYGNSKSRFDNTFNILDEEFSFDVLTTRKSSEDLELYLEKNKKHLESVLELKLVLKDPNSIFLRSDSNARVFDGTHCASKFEEFSDVLYPIFCRLVDLKIKNPEWSEDEVFENALEFTKEYIKVKR